MRLNKNKISSEQKFLTKCASIRLRVMEQGRGIVGNDPRFFTDDYNLRFHYNGQVIIVNPFGHVCGGATIDTCKDNVFGNPLYADTLKEFIRVCEEYGLY